VIVTFKVYGHPEPQGSTRAFVPKGWTRPIITSANKKQKPWRQEVTRTAIEAMEKFAIIKRPAPVYIEMRFYVTKPKSKPKKVIFHTTKPDLDKLARAVSDSLTGIVYEDDSQITAALIEKNYGVPERVEIVITNYEP